MVTFFKETSCLFYHGMSQPSVLGLLCVESLSFRFGQPLYADDTLSSILLLPQLKLKWSPVCLTPVLLILCAHARVFPSGTHSGGHVCILVFLMHHAKGINGRHPTHPSVSLQSWLWSEHAVCSSLQQTCHFQLVLFISGTHFGVLGPLSFSFFPFPDCPQLVVSGCQAALSTRGTYAKVPWLQTLFQTSQVMPMISSHSHCLKCWVRVTSGTVSILLGLQDKN